MQKIFRTAFCLVILLSSFGLIGKVSAQTTCNSGTPITGGANVTISSSCSDLVINGAGNVVINSVVTAASSVYAVEAVGANTSLNNTGTISSTSSGALDTYGVYNNNAGTITTLINSGSASISGTSTGTGDGYGIQNYGLITTLTNSGSASISGASPVGDATGGYGISNRGTITTLNNIGSASISGTGGTSTAGAGIFNAGTITTLNNSGSARILGNATSAGLFGFGVYNIGIITTLNNIDSASISGTGNAFIYDIFNNGGGGLITTLNNSQGGNSSSIATTVLTYQGNVPINYNIGIASSTHYGQLSVASFAFGASRTITNFGIYAAPFITSRIYASVLTNNVTVTNLQSKYDNMTLTLVNNAITGAYDLTFTGASLMGTQQSLVNTANALAPIYSLQNSVIVNSFTYDCTLFDVNNICISAGGRNTAVSAANGLNNTSALLIAAYRPHPNYRVGAYADQNLSVSNAGSTVNLSNNTPLLGLFGAWNERLDGTGTEVKVSAAYGQKNTTITRQVVGTSEAGSGSSQLNSQGAQVMAKYGFAVTDKATVSPYVGVRYTQNNMGGYTEGASSTVTAPLTYSALNTNATTALAGLGASYKVIPTVTTFASAGVETDTNTSNGSYSATGVTGLTPVNFNPNPVRTRPTAMVGAYYDIVKNQRLGITGIYRQEAYQAVANTTVMATYTIGL